MTIKFALSGEFADQAFAAEEAAHKVFAGFADFEFERVFECNNMTGIDHVLALDIYLIDGPKATEEEVSRAAALHPEHAFAAEERFAEPLPSGIDIDAGIGSKPT